ncbi:MAG TPA: hypothetical protein VKG38_18475 [Solirubrobacteraceae bacterium]|nr:hypothetical protein [Solirubrobacteraceae bacterium]
MSDFVDHCRQEWKRLGVPDPLADEMAADLASDLGEAEGEGVSPEQFLGSSAFDPRSFAASWATERGVVPVPGSPGRARHRPLALVAFTGLAAVALTVAALLLLTGEPRLTLVTSRSGPPHAPALSAIPSLPPGPGHRVQASAATPVEWILLFLAIAALCFAGWLWSSWRRSVPPTAPA